MTVYTISKKIFVVTELYYPEETSTGYFLTKIAEGLATKFPVTVLCVQPTYSSRGVKAPQDECRNNVKIHRCKASSFNKNRIFFRIFNIITISFSIFFQLFLRLSQRDRVLVVTNPPILPYLVALACLLKRARCFLLVHDVYPEVLVAAGIASSGGTLVKTGNCLSNILYRYSHRIIVLGRDMRQLVLKKIVPQRDDKIVIIPNWSDIEDIYPLSRSTNPLLEELHLVNKFVVTYAGNMGRTHGLENIFNAANILNGVESDIHFIMCGTGAKRAWLESVVKGGGITNITLLPNQPRTGLNTLLNACDIAIISFMPGMAGISVPSRMYNLLAAGKPIIAVADPNSELAHVIKEEEIGWVIPPDEPDLIAQCIILARTQKTFLSSMGTNARSAAECKYTLDTIITKYVSLFNDDINEDYSHASNQRLTH